MNAVTKAIKGTSSRPTRFHSERGELLGKEGWVDLPRAICRRLSRKPSAEPWMVPAAVEHIAARIRPAWHVLELGSGSSTAWYGQRAQRVLSFEDEPDWYQRTLSMTQRVPNCQIRFETLEGTLAAVSDLPDDSFDLVVVDSHENAEIGRVDLARASRSKVRPGGMLVFDDFDRPDYRRAEPLFSGWSTNRFVGVKGLPLTATETTIFRRPE